MREIVQATSLEQLTAVRDLMMAFLGFAWERYASHPDLMEKYFGKEAMARELEGLPGRYAPPKGSLLLASIDDKPAGCVGMRDLGQGICEMKRMYIVPSAQGQGLGRALAERLLADAKAAGHTLMRLDTGYLQPDAQKLYESLGFRRIPAYYDLPDDLRVILVFYERPL